MHNLKPKPNHKTIVSACSSLIFLSTWGHTQKV